MSETIQWSLYSVLGGAVATIDRAHQRSTSAERSAYRPIFELKYLKIFWFFIFGQLSIFICIFIILLKDFNPVKILDRVIGSDPGQLDQSINTKLSVEII